jgi:hypothetical protein
VPAGLDFFAKSFSSACRSRSGQPSPPNPFFEASRREAITSGAAVMRVGQRARPSDYALVPERSCLSFGAPKLLNQKPCDQACGISALDQSIRRWASRGPMMYSTMGFLLLVIISILLGRRRKARNSPPNSRSRSDAVLVTPPATLNVSGPPGPELARLMSLPPPS